MRLGVVGAFLILCLVPIAHADDWPSVMGSPSHAGFVGGEGSVATSWEHRNARGLIDGLVSGNGHAFYAGKDVGSINLTTGDVEWLWTPPDGLEASGIPALSEGDVFAIVHNRTHRFVVSSDAASGDLQWISNSNDSFGDGINGAYPIVVKGLVIAAGTREVVAFHADSGRKAWRVEQEELSSSAIFGRNAILYGDTRGVIRAIALDDGHEIWATNISRTAHAMTVDDELVYVISGSSITAIDQSSGAVRWSVEMPDRFGGHPSVCGNRLIVPNGSKLFAYSSDGKQAWSRSFDNLIFGAVACDPSTLTVAEYDGRIDILNAADGTKIATAKAPIQFGVHFPLRAGNAVIVAGQSFKSPTSMVIEYPIASVIPSPIGLARSGLILVIEVLLAGAIVGGIVALAWGRLRSR